VFYRQTNESYSVANVTESIREAFEGADDFVPTTLFIATWKSVGYFDRNTDQVCVRAESKITCNSIAYMSVTIGFPVRVENTITLVTV